MPDWKILDGGVTETTRTDERQRFIPVRIVRFMVGTHGPFQIQVDAKDFTGEHVSALLDAQAVEVRKLFPT